MTLISQIKRIVSLAGLSFMAVISLSGFSHKNEWPQLAVRLTGEADQVRKKAISELRDLPQLEAVLRKELSGERKFLAIDVISALKLEVLLPDLLKFSEKDESGFFYNAINALMDGENRTELLTLYRARIGNDSTPAAAKVALLDTLSRLQIPLGAPLLKKLVLQDPSADVRSAALHYVRQFLLKKDMEFFPLVALALHSDPFQLRIQAMYLISELNPKWRSFVLRELEECMEDDNSEVREACGAISGRLRKR